MPETPSIPPGIVRLREQHQATTRETILRAARTLFAEHGYEATTVRLIAQQSGVAVQTLYGAFGSKAGVLAGLPDLIDEEAEVYDNVARRDQTQDPTELLVLLTNLVRRVWERCGDIIDLLQATAASQPDLAAALGEGMKRHRFGIEWTVQRIAEAGKLKQDLSIGRASDIVEAMLTRDVCITLVEQRGWSFDEYEAWVTATLLTLLLEP